MENPNGARKTFVDALSKLLVALIGMIPFDKDKFSETYALAVTNCNRFAKMVSISELFKQAKSLDAVRYLFENFGDHIGQADLADKLTETVDIDIFNYCVEKYLKVFVTPCEFSDFNITADVVGRPFDLQRYELVCNFTQKNMELCDKYYRDERITKLHTAIRSCYQNDTCDDAKDQCDRWNFPTKCECIEALTNFGVEKYNEGLLDEDKFDDLCSSFHVYEAYDEDEDDEDEMSYLKVVKIATSLTKAAR